MHHYNFPPFSVGEVRRLGGTGRREIGHGALGERALEAVIPSEEEFPYTIRIVSEVLGSNGSTSQASICAGSHGADGRRRADQGPVAGVAMGLVTGEDPLGAPRSVAYCSVFRLLSSCQVPVATGVPQFLPSRLTEIEYRPMSPLKLLSWRGK